MLFVNTKNNYINIIYNLQNNHRFVNIKLIFFYAIRMYS